MLLDRFELEELVDRCPESGFAVLAAATSPEALELFGPFPLPDASVGGSFGMAKQKV